MGKTPKNNWGKDKVKDRRNKILVLVHPKFRPDRARPVSATELDVWRTLRRMGSIVEIAAAESDLRAFDKILAAFMPNAVFNLLEEFRSEAVFDFHLVSYLEALGIPCTGCNPRGLIQSRNKYLTGQIATGIGIQTPRSAIVGSPASDFTKLKFPLFVKLNREHASLGIRESSQVHDHLELKREIKRLKSSYGGEIIVQEFVRGSDVSVAAWGNGRVETFRPRILEMGGVGQVSTERFKFSAALQSKRKARSKFFNSPAVDSIRSNALKVFAALDLSGYARLDFRVGESGVPLLIDVNANPNLSRTEDFALSARANGHSYAETLHRILDLAITYEPRV